VWTDENGPALLPVSEVRHLLTLTDWSRDDLKDLYLRADLCRQEHQSRVDGVAVMFFPTSSLRTRVSFERAAVEMGLQSIVFPPETLDKSEDLRDVAGYLASWASLIVVRHPDIAVLERLAEADTVPVVNAMTDANHPCEVLSDLYALSQDTNIFALRFLFVGADGNIARAWWEASRAFGLDIRQSCPRELRVPDMPWNEDLSDAMTTADVVITDGPGIHADALASYIVTQKLLDTAPVGVRFAPCPPFIRGREASADAIAHPAFVGYEFKRYLKPVQQAVMSWVLDA